MVPQTETKAGAGFTVLYKDYRLTYSPRGVQDYRFTYSPTGSNGNSKLREQIICRADRNEGYFPDHSSDFSESGTFDVEDEEAGPIPVPVGEAEPIPVPVEEAGPIPLPGEEIAPAIPLPVEEVAPAIPLPVEEVAPAIPLFDYLDGIRTPEQIVRTPEARRGVNPPPIPPAPPGDGNAAPGDGNAAPGGDIFNQTNEPHFFQLEEGGIMEHKIFLQEKQLKMPKMQNQKRIKIQRIIEVGENFKGNPTQKIVVITANNIIYEVVIEFRKKEISQKDRMQFAVLAEPTLVTYSSSSNSFSLYSLYTIVLLSLTVLLYKIGTVLLKFFSSKKP